ncbi:MAG: hypothetical protein WCO66_00340 [Candidatus Absconditabacteria bacterium]
MKKQYKFLGGLLAIVCCVNFVGAQSLSNLMDSLGTSITFGYSNSKKITIKSIGSGNIITIESPLVKDDLGKSITSYTVMYSQYPLTDILEKTDLLSQTKETSVELTGSNDPFTIDVTIDNPDITKKYYFFVIPKDTNKNFGQISNEVWVNLANGTKGEAGDVNGTPDTTHAAATVDMSLAHISHTLNGKTITLTWSAIAGSKTIEIDVMKPGESLFTKAKTVNMNDEKYIYTADKNGEYTFRFIAVDCQQSINYTLTMEGLTETPATPETPAKITKVPKTGPAENAIVIVIVALLMYFGYSKLYKKNK